RTGAASLHCMVSEQSVGHPRTREIRASAALFAVFLGLFDLDELLAFGDFLDNAVKRLLAAFKNGICHATGVQSNSFGGVIVARDHEVDAIGRMVGVDHCNDGDTQSA